jgi:hypothetical protein
MLVSKTNSLTQSRQNPGSNKVSSLAKCPWTWGVTVDDNRYPRKIVYAICTSSTCKEYYCRPVKYHMMVLTRNGSEWGVGHEKTTMAFVYTG